MLCVWPALSSLRAQQAIRINAGGASSTFNATDGTQWQTDRDFSGGDTLYTSDPIGNTQDRYLYATARYGLYGNFEYAIPMANGDYRLTLKFAEIYYWYKGDRVFNVIVNGNQVLSNFDILAEVPSRTALDKTFPVSVTNGVLRVQFEGVVHYGTVSAIVVEPSTAQPVTISLNPAQVSLMAGKTQQFTATVGGTTNTAVTWSATAGTVSSTGLYTAPATVTQAATATVTATSVADAARTASATVSLQTPVQVSVTPSSGNVTSGQTLQMAANVTGTTDTRVTWSASSGSISAGGLFTAPTVTAPTVATLTAKSVADTTVSAVAQITVNPVAAVPTNPTFLESGGQVTVEAEDGTIVNRAQSWTPQTADAGYSGTTYLTATPNNGVYYATGYVGVSPEVQYRIKFATTGTYYVWVRGYSTGPADDSINIGLDGAAVSTGATLSQFTAGEWGWSNMAMDSTYRITLNVATAGVHTVNAWMREDGFSFDKILLTTDASFTPSGLGPAESPTDSGLPVLNLSTGNVSFSALAGVNPAAQTVNVSNLGAGSLNWTAADSQSWLAVSPASGANASALTVAANAAGMAAGNYTGTITVTAPGATNSPKTINVSLSVTATAPVQAAALGTSPRTLQFSATAGSAAPSSQNVSITNAGGGAMSWTASKSQSWLTLSASSGTAPSTLGVGVNAGALAAGTYNGAVTLTAAGAAGSPQTVAVTLTVAATAGTSNPGSSTGLPTTGRQWHVSPTGTASGDGSAARPWSLTTALNMPSAVQPGDTIWLHGGLYGNGSTFFNSYLRGTASAPVILRAYPGERPIINGGIGTYSPYTWYWGFEVMSTLTDRSATRSSPECIDTYDNSVGVKLINLVLHDCTQGIGFWSAATNAEAHGNIIYYNGVQGSDRGHGHGIYIQNGPTGTK
ncbi:MAG: malectin domain-containing carbohydrate-binding protein, partial [Acidobacteria bacterium]|nr:malectin domain-containing carbohydrate-binding protein [Acidobacteriota bacterium]